MSALLGAQPYRGRDDDALLAEMNALTKHHVGGCPEYAHLFGDRREAGRVDELPFLHTGLFKHVQFKTGFAGAVHERTLRSSSTTGAGSFVQLDKASSELQGASSAAILSDFLGERIRPLLVLDSAKSLQGRGEVSARVAAALSLKPLASEIHFVLGDAEDPRSLRAEVVRDALARHDEVIVYGFSWILWSAWAAQPLEESLRKALKGKRVHFVHSGGWKKLEAAKVDPVSFNERLLAGLHPSSRVTDFYGLVEQVGVVYPLCAAGFRHVPRWADVLVRDPLTLRSLPAGKSGLLQLMNVLALGAPYHNVLTEDLGVIEAGPCSCGREGKRFSLLGRLPRAEVRGCANV